MDADRPQPAAVAPHGRKLTVDEFLAARLTPPPGVGPVSLQDMDRAVAEGANGRGSPLYAVRVDELGQRF